MKYNMIANLLFLSVFMTFSCSEKQQIKSEHISLDNINYCAVDKLLDKEINSSKLFIEQILS